MSCRWIGRLLALLLGLVMLAGAAEPAATLPPGWPDTERFLQGRYVYERNCAVCHGRWGNGAGEMAAGMFPRPRPFTSGIFKYRSTPAGFLPTNEDLARTIRNGLANTSMPMFSHLSDTEISAVTEYVKTFSHRWRQKDNYADPLPEPAPPEWFTDEKLLHVRRENGRQQFMLACSGCHGEHADGRGPAAESLTDTWGNASLPPDLLANVLRTGSTPGDMFRVLQTGMDGTPMPSFREALTEDQRWEIIVWLQEVRKQPPNPKP